MTKFISRLLLVVAALLVTVVSQAQDNNGSTDVMRSNGKIYVVVAVCLTILLGLFLYVFSIDRKISKLQKER